MKVLLVSLLLLLSTSALTSFLFREPGYVLISIGQYSIEMSLLAVLIISTLIFIILYSVIRLISHLSGIPLRFSSAHKGYRSQRSNQDLIAGLTQFAQGNWAQSEKLLVNSVAYSDTPWLSYISAAQAAQEQGNHIQRDDYLEKAHNIAPEYELAISLARAKSQIAQGQTEQALATLTRLHSMNPQHSYVIKLLSRLYLNAKEWNNLYRMLPTIRKSRAYNSAALEKLEKTIYKGKLENAAAVSNLKQLNRDWKQLPRKLRSDKRMIYLYAKCLRKLGQHDTAEFVLRNALNRLWSETLAGEYGLVELRDPSAQLMHGETWLRSNKHSSMLLLSLARICRRAKLWGKARIYYESSLSLTPLPETYNDLAVLLDQLGDQEGAQECYQKGLRLAVEGVADPLRTRSEKYTEKYREATLKELVTV